MTVEGHSCRAYSQRPGHAPDLLLDARRWAERTYLVQGSRRISFAQHELAARRVCRYFKSLGVTPGSRVMLLGANQPEWVIAFWATLLSGGIAVPANFWWSEPELRHALEITKPTVVVTDSPAQLNIDTMVVSFGELRVIADAEDTEDVTNRDDTPAGLSEDDPAAIIFTSGTTGWPKGVTLSHRSLVANVQNRLIVGGNVTPGDPQPRSLVSSPLFHMGGVQTILLGLATGSMLVVLEGRFDAGEALRLIEEEAITRWGCVPTMAHRVLKHPDLEWRDCPSLQTISMAGAPVPPELYARLQDAFPSVTLGTGYGLTESGGTLAAGSGADLVGGIGCVGRPMPTVELRIDDPDETGRGEVLARSPTVMSGYWNRVDDPTLESDGWLHTGDLGRLDGDGRLYILGRLKDVIIRGGENIAPLRVENHLLAHPGVADVAVVGLPHPDLGEEVAAVVVPVTGASLSVAELRDHAASALAYFEVPTRWWIRADPLPTNQVGKVSKVVLRDDFRDAG